MFAQPPPRGTETVLVVVPEPETRALAAFMLAKQGYRVLEARTPADALRIFDEQGPVDLLFVEARMPKVNGPALAETLRAKQPQLRVLFVSDGRGPVVPPPALLPRPFTMSVLAGKVRQALDAPRALRAGG
jgi:two-component system, cell cycle sensor histidine kinase and response regulator CckA